MSTAAWRKLREHARGEMPAAAPPAYDGHWRAAADRREQCGEWTDRFAQLESFVVHGLFSAHLNREGRSRLLAGRLASR